ncbi:hypothetical protein [Lentibacillus sp. JNUCC-1]|uniref:hypothetical protein n=1 Tax=Lentibacillus sp. JNUCC-1 TaxID=2654513 RepID=UPI0012E8B627|nr:hypothetical protein [Lentibacillus sp. JNUCC-1]
MMKHLKNERGAALVLTIMIITLMLLFTLTLTYQVMNTRKQVETTEETIEARSLAEMGVTYYQTLVDETLDGQEFETIQDVVNKLPEPPEKTIENNTYFEITNVTQNEISEDELEITFTSIGTAQDRTAEIEQSITITLE